MNNIEKNFEQYKIGYAQCKDCDERLFAPSDLSSWTQALKDRSKITSSVFETNTRMIKEHFTPMIQGKIPMSAQEMESLYFCTVDMYRNDYEDPFILKLFLSALLPYYLEHEDIQKIVQIYVMSGFADIEISRTSDKEAGRRSVEYYRKATEYKEKIMEMMDDEAMTSVYTAYVNLCFVEGSLSNLTQKEMDQYIHEFIELRSTPACLAMEKKNDRMRALAERLKSGEAIVQGLPFTEEFFDDAKLSTEYFNRVHAEFQQQLQSSGSVLELNPVLVFNEYCGRAWLGVWSWNKAFEEAERYFEVVDETAENRPDLDLIQFELAVPLSLLNFLDRTEYSEEEKQEKANRIMERFVDFVGAYPSGVNTYTLIDGLQIFTFNPLVMRFLKDTDTRRRFVFTLLVTRQPVTYIHCSMVARLLTILLSQVFEQHPEWLIGLCDTRDVESVLKQRKEIMDFAGYAALFHDIGKNNMIDIVGTEYRAITDEEFAILKTHPSKGAEYLNQVEDFRDYADVAYGHHQFYDNTGGYPSVEEFDHQKSHVRFLIEAVTLCDCLDAATDDLGRNYQKAKTFEKVLQEFENGAGHQYNPDLVQLIKETEQLQVDMKNLVQRDRGKVCYEVYRQFFRK